MNNLFLNTIYIFYVYMYIYKHILFGVNGLPKYQWIYAI